MDRVLVGVDGSADSFHALRWGSRLAGLGAMELVVAWAAETGAGPQHAQMLEVEHWCSHIGGMSVSVKKVIVHGHPPEALLEAADEVGAGLLVVGTRGAGRFPRPHLGSVAENLTAHTAVPLAVVPARAALSVNRLVVGVDGSPGSAAAVDLTAELVAVLAVPVTAVYGFDAGSGQVAEKGLYGYRKQALDDVRTRILPIEKVGARCDVYIDVDRDVDPVAAIEYALRSEAGSVAVVGTGGLGAFSGARVGRVALHLVHHCGDPLILVPG